MFATFIEPVWTILNRNLCLLEPFEELRKGQAKASKSIGAKYTSVPPQLAVWRALRAGHYILAAVCLVAVSSNVLAVALSGLLNESPATVFVPVISSQSLLPRFNGSGIFDANDISGPGAYFVSQSSCYVTPIFNTHFLAGTYLRHSGKHHRIKSLASVDRSEIFLLAIRTEKCEFHWKCIWKRHLSSFSWLYRWLRSNSDLH